MQCFGRSRLHDELALLVHLHLLHLHGLLSLCVPAAGSLRHRVPHMTHLDTEGKLMTWDRGQRLHIIAIKHQQHHNITLLVGSTHTLWPLASTPQELNYTTRSSVGMNGSSVSQKRLTAVSRLRAANLFLSCTPSEAMKGTFCQTDRLEDRGCCPSWRWPTAGSLSHFPETHRDKESQRNNNKHALLTSQGVKYSQRIKT